MIGMGFSQNWEQMAALRVVLGILEAGRLVAFSTGAEVVDTNKTNMIGFFPSCVYLLSTWYTRCESAHL